jgi:ABC-type lipoprotein export system ATPase subunit
LDEPSKYISKGNYASNFADYMRDIATFTNKQIIMSTHDEAMLDIGNTRYSIRMNPLTKVSEITKEY